eukprot:TRINITY_DN89893_c0_g1_i1.p1 TRINITY_DN89893_c0_g1~~TRINITY_DN89893_c0_g1_i1.p1  ORF type:complete len:285 (+),score=38.40 TRINITY_DN89893_c0_g1_i1:61-915(+)
MPENRGSPRLSLNAFSSVDVGKASLMLFSLLFMRLCVEMLGPDLLSKEVKGRSGTVNQTMPSVKHFLDHPHYGAFLKVAEFDFVFVKWSKTNGSLVEPSDSLLIYQKSGSTQIGEQHEMLAGFAGEVEITASISPGEEVVRGRPLALIGHPRPKAGLGLVGLAILLTGSIMVAVIAVSRIFAPSIVVVFPWQIIWHMSSGRVSLLHLQQVATSEPEDRIAQQPAATETMAAGHEIAPYELLAGASSRARTPSPDPIRRTQINYHGLSEKEHDQVSDATTPRARP